MRILREKIKIKMPLKASFLFINSLFHVRLEEKYGGIKLC